VTKNPASVDNRSITPCLPRKFNMKRNPLYRLLRVDFFLSEINKHDVWDAYVEQTLPAPEANRKLFKTHFVKKGSDATQVHGRILDFKPTIPLNGETARH
jgi:hypothetical protein